MNLTFIRKFDTLIIRVSKIYKIQEILKIKLQSTPKYLPIYIYPSSEEKKEISEDNIRLLQELMVFQDTDDDEYREKLKLTHSKNYISHLF